MKCTIDVYGRDSRNIVYNRRRKVGAGGAGAPENFSGGGRVPPILLPSALARGDLLAALCMYGKSCLGMST